MTAIDDEQRGAPVLPLTSHALKAAYWKAARDGLEGLSIDLPDTRAPLPATRLLSNLVDRVEPALKAVGDADMVREELTRITAEGNGAMRQRRAWGRRHEVGDVIEEAAAATLAGVSPG
jgi:carboxylate-amine ligase